VRAAPVLGAMTHCNVQRAVSDGCGLGGHD
jgi:hypothetical protein